MHFDDRLATVLRQPPGGKAMARIQFRQLLDLLGTRASGERSPQIDAALVRLAELAKVIPAIERAAILGEPGLRLRNPRLVAELAGAEPPVAIAAIGCAALSDEQWLDLVPALPVAARGALRQRRHHSPALDALLERLGIGERGLPAPAAAAAPAEAPAQAYAEAPPQTPVAAEPPAVAPATKPAGEAPVAAAPVAEPLPRSVPRLASLANKPAPAPRRETPVDEPADGESGIGAIVRRIEAFRKTRRPTGAPAAARPPAGGDAPRLPLRDFADAPPRRIESFDFLTDGDGRIVWTEPGIAPMAVGLRIDGRDSDSPATGSAELAMAFRLRQPIRNAPLRVIGAPALTGAWQVDAAPRFDPVVGRFTGYCGRMRRPASIDTALPSAPRSEADRMRQVLHELKTPINAIQGFAEAIQQQLFGPTPHEYRALAASIAGDSARILAAFEELERLAKLDSGALKIEGGECDLRSIVTGIVTRLDAYGAPRDSGFALEITGDAALPVAIAEAEAERLIWRLLATIATASGLGERLRLAVARRGTGVQLSIRLPESLAKLDGDALFRASIGAGTHALSAGMFGTGFALRLAAVEVRSAGGTLDNAGGEIAVFLPGPTRDGLSPHDVPESESPVTGPASPAATGTTAEEHLAAVRTG